MTEKLYYKDAYIKEFEACVLSCEPCEGGFDTVLDKTAFFPEEGGQYSDNGKIGNAAVSYVYEKEGIIHHITDKPVWGTAVFCSIDFEERFEKMQIHTGEHIVSGVFHNLYSYDNVGFHLGRDAVTMDINALLTEEQIRRAELLANEIIYKNIA